MPIAPSSSRQCHARVTDTRCTDTRAVLCRVALSNLRSVTHHIHSTLCWSYVLLQKLQVACTLLPIHARGCRARGAVQTVVLLLLYELKSSSLCSLPWQQCGSRWQPREGSNTYAYHTCLLLLSSSTYYIPSFVRLAPLLPLLLPCPFPVFVGLPGFPSACVFSNRIIRIYQVALGPGFDEPAYDIIILHKIPNIT